MKNFITNITTIKHAIKNRKLVIFAGAGISIDAGVPLWKDLISQLSEDIDIPEDENDYTRIAQIYYNERGAKEYVQRIRSILKHKQVRYNKIHEAIFELNPEHILTTNYDDLLDQTIDAKGHLFSVISKDNNFPHAKYSNFLVKIHGDLEDHNFVLKEEDYLDYSESYPLTENFLKNIFTQNLILFIGYSFSDPNVKMVVQRVRKVLDNDFQNAYLLSLDKELHPSKREYLKRSGITTVNYYDANKDSDYIQDYLSGANALHKKYRTISENLSDLGQRLLDFLIFIKEYDSFHESLSRKSIIEQQYISLKRFEELPVLLPDFVSFIYPFNYDMKVGHVYDYVRGAMLSENEQLTSFYNHEVEEGGLRLKKESKEKLSNKGLSENNIKNSENKLKEVVNILCSSFIYYIKEKSNHAEGFPLKHTVNTICECPKCLYSTLQFNHLIKKAEKYSITNISDIKEDLLYAYASYKLCNYKKAFFQFEEIATKARKSNRLLTYYTAKNNVKKLRNLIAFPSDEDGPTLVRKIDQINLDSLLTSLTDIDKQQKELLSIVKDDDILLRTDRKIVELRDKIKKVYDLYNRGGWQSGSLYYREIQLELVILYSFYTDNSIIYDEYEEFKRIFRKGIESLLISYATHESYEGRLKEFDHFFFLFFVYYGEADELEKILIRYKIKEVKFKEEEQEKILALVNNLLTSNHKYIPKGFLSLQENKDIRAHLEKNFFFNDKFLRIFNKVFLLLSRTQLNKVEAQKLIGNLRNFLEKENFLFWKDIKYLSLFISRNPNLFSKEDCIKFLKTSLDKEHYYKSDSEFLDAFKSVFRERSTENRISDKELIYNVLDYAMKVNKKEFKEDILISLWVISDDKIRKEIGLLIEEKLKEKFSIELYRLAFWEEILSLEQFKEEFLKIFSRLKEEDAQKILERDDMSNHQNTNQFLNFIGACYHKEKYFDKSIKEFIKKASNFVKFFLLPKEFNYSKFNPHWLRLYPVSAESSSVIYKRLSKIDKIKPLLEAELKRSYNEELGQIYLKYFL